VVETTPGPRVALAPKSGLSRGPTMAQGVHEFGSQADEPAPPPRDTAIAGVVVEYSGDRPSVVVTGQVDRAKVTEVSGIVRGLVAVGVRVLTVDLTASWDSTALLPVLARARAEMADDGGSLRVVGVALPEFLAALSDAPLDEVFLVYDTVRSEVSPETRQTSSVRRRADW
jgi:hypothetical protein